jgi:hypothetical protein|tara:strand:- start:701 stop:952 length:252 start_codon:yes stop_codon:yes gene_type:complete
MKINYNRLLELNKEALIDNERTQLSAFYVVQSSIEKFSNGEQITEEAKNLLIELGVLVQTEEDIARETIVGPFNFSQHGPTNT